MLRYSRVIVDDNRIALNLIDDGGGTFRATMYRNLRKITTSYNGGICTYTEYRDLTILPMFIQCFEGLLHDHFGSNRKDEVIETLREWGWL